MSDTSVVGGSGSASTTGARTPERVKAPLVGIVVGLILVGGLATWTGLRINVATRAQNAVAERRDSDARSAAALAKIPERVAVVQGVAAKWLPSVELDGTLQAQQSASLGFKVGGKIGSLKVKVGDRVASGALLATLDAGEASAQAAAVAAQVRAAEAQLALARDAEQRTQSLVQSGSFSEASGVQVSQQRALALAQLDAVKAQQALARVSLGNHVLSAPFAGTVTKVPDGIGAVVAPGAPLFEIVDTRTLKLATSVTEHDANLLVPGAPVELTTENGKVMGRISAVLATVDEKTRRVPVEAAFDNPGVLRAGAFVRARVGANSEIDVVRVPHGVLRPGSQDEVMVIREGGRLEARPVVYAVDKDGSLLVRRGLRSDEKLVENPRPEAKTGDQVTLPAAAGAKP